LRNYLSLFNISNCVFLYMLSTSDIETKLQQMKPVLAERFHVSEIGYFGSYVHGQQSDNSDLDLVVEFSQPVGWSFFTLERFLEQSLGLQIDLVTKSALKLRIKESILNQVKYI
jgi:predicted nucleotidyltransferase